MNCKNTINTATNPLKMNRTDSLFRLIKSLSQSEKRYFKLYASLWGSEKSNYLKLFEILDNQEKYDEAVIEAAIAGESFADYLPNVKKYLFTTILKSLRNFHDEHNDIMQLLNMIKNVSILRHKGLIPEAVKQYRKAKNLLIEGEFFTLLIELLNTGEVLWASYLQNKDLAIKLEQIHEEKNQYTGYLRKVIEYRALAHQIKSTINDLYPIRNLEQEKLIQAYLNHPLLQSIDQAPTLITKTNYYQCLIFCHGVLLDYAKVYENGLQCFELLEPVKDTSIVYQKLYIANLSNLILSCTEVGAIKDFEHYAEVFQQYTEKISEGIPTNMVIQNKKRRYNYTIHHYFYTKQFKELIILADELLDFIQENDQYLDTDWKLTVRFDTAIAYFNLQQYDFALQWVEYILQEEKNNPKLALLGKAKILEIMIHYELGHVLLLESLFRSAYRFLRKKDLLFKVERILLNFFRRISQDFHQERLDKDFIKLKKQLLQIADNKYEMNFFKTLDLNNWLEKHIDD